MHRHIDPAISPRPTVVQTPGLRIRGSRMNHPA